MVKVNFCYRTKCSQVGKCPKRWDLGSLRDEQTVSQFDEKLREQGVGVINMDWKTLATTVKVWERTEQKLDDNTGRSRL